MAAASCLLSEDQFLCPICLDVFNDPVTTTCGHNFCKDCITEHWNVSVPWRCPICKELFASKPELHTNIFISEMAAQFKQSAQQKTSSSSSSSSEQAAAKPGEVPCDICPGPRLKALKSCLVCLVSYCETHLEPHLTVAGLKRHQLMEPVENLENRMCLKHNKFLELFCRTDQTCICMLCTVSDHKNHNVVPLKEECEEMKAELVKTEAEIQQMIQKRRLKIKEIEHSVKVSGENADKVISEGVQVVSVLKESFDRILDELIKATEKGQIEIEKQAEEFIKELEQEISELKKRSSVVEQLFKSEDHLHLLQTFPSLDAPQATKDWTKVWVHPSSYQEILPMALTVLKETFRNNLWERFGTELKKVQQYTRDVTLDLDTAHPELILSNDGKQVNHGDMKKNLTDNPKRFSKSLCVLGKQSLSSGRFYFEVQVKGKTNWTLGVVRKSINRKENIILKPSYGYWTVCLRNGTMSKALDESDVCLWLKPRPQKVGVFVDYEEGLVSFFDANTRALFYSFTGCYFTEKLYPFFGPCPSDGGKNSAPLIITPVQHKKQN